MVGGPPEVSPWAEPPSQKALCAVGRGVSGGCAGDSVGPAAIMSQLTSPRLHLLVFRGCLCPHGGSVKYWSGEGVSNSASAQGHAWCRVGNNPAVGPSLLSSTSAGSEDIILGSAFFPSRVQDLLPAPGMGLLGWRRVTAAVGLPSRNPVPNAPLPPLQVMLVGDSGVGKTCLLVRFKDGAFLAGSFISTVGIDFRVSA